MLHYLTFLCTDNVPTLSPTKGLGSKSSDDNGCRLSSQSLSNSSAMMRTLNLDDSVEVNVDSLKLRVEKTKTVTAIGDTEGLANATSKVNIITTDNSPVGNDQSIPPSLPENIDMEKSWYYCEHVLVPEDPTQTSKPFLVCNGQRENLDKFVDVKEMILRVLLSPSVSNESIISTCTQALEDHHYLVKMKSKGFVIGSKSSQKATLTPSVEVSTPKNTSEEDQPIKRIQQEVVKVVNDAATQAAQAAKKIDEFVHKRTGQTLSLAKNFPTKSVERKDETAVCLVGIERKTKDRVLIIGVNSANVQDGSGTRTSIFSSIREALDAAQLSRAGSTRRRKNIDLVGLMDDSTDEVEFQVDETADSVSSVNELKTLHGDYLRDLQVSYQVYCGIDLAAYVQKMDAEVESVEWKLARLMSLLTKTYKTYGVKLPKLQRTLPLRFESFNINGGVLPEPELARLIQKSMVQYKIGRESFTEVVEKLKRVLNSRWDKHIESLKVQKAEYCQIRLSRIEENCKILIETLRDDEYALKHKVTKDLAKKTNLSILECGVVLAKVGALYKGKPGTLFATFNRLVFVTTFIYSSVETFELRNFDTVKVEKDKMSPLSMLGSGMLKLYPKSSGKERESNVEVSKLEVKIIIPSASDLERFADLVLELLKSNREKTEQESKAEPESDQAAAPESKIFTEQLDNGTIPGNSKNPFAGVSYPRERDMTASTMLREDEFEL